MTESGEPGGPVRTDAFLGGRLHVTQSLRGHRVGTDAVLLAAAAPVGFSGRAADLGAGVGVVGIAFALREAACSVTLVEIDPDLCRLAAMNAAANDLGARVDVIRADMLAGTRDRRAAGLAGDSFDLVLTNPPFDDAGRGRPSPDAAKRLAHRSAAGELEAWFAAAADVLRHKGRLVAILRADGLARVLPALSPAFGGITILPVHPREDAAATRILVQAVRGSRAPLAIVPGFVLHGKDGSFTPRAEAVHRGEAAITW